MKKSLFVLLTAFAFLPLARGVDPVVPAGFEYEVLYKGHGMTAIDFDASGGMFVCEKMGRVLLFEPKGKEFNDPVVLLDISKGLVNPDNESGLLGIAVDPQFNTNHYVYVFYTTSTDQQLARYTLNAGRTALENPLVLISGFPRTHTNHKAGDIHFSPKDPNSIYLVLGNDADPNSTLVDNLDVYNGKILRMNKANGQGLPDNPFYDGNPDSVKSRIWATGMRNPFRFTFAPSGEPANALYISENGDGTDRQALVLRGGDGGWNKGNDRGLISPPDPKVHVLITKKPSLTGVAIADKGPFATAAGSVYYFAKWYDVPGFGPVIYRAQFSPTKDSITPIDGDNDGMFATHLKCVNLKFGPDGSLYTTDTSGAADGNGFILGRIKAVAQ